MTLVKVHRVLTFRHSAFLKQYIDYCTQKRAESKSDFRKRLFKAFSNSNFGKFIEQKRKHLNVKLVRTDSKLNKAMSNPRFTNYKIISDTLVAVFMKVKSIKMTQAIGIGFSILERSKALVFSDYYEKILPALDYKCNVLFTDTDSVCLEVRGLMHEDVVNRLSFMLDFSNYPKNHPLYNDRCRNQLGFWKDETKGKKIIEFVGLSSKTYAMRVECDEGLEEQNSKCKGVRRGFRKKIPFETFKKCVTNISAHKVSQYGIQSKSHKIYTIKSEKICFTSFDDKRFIFPCGIHSVPYGSKRSLNMSCPYCQVK